MSMRNEVKRKLNERKFIEDGYKGNTVANLISLLEKLPRSMAIEQSGELGFSVKMLDLGSVKGIRATIVGKNKSEQKNEK